MFRYDIPTQGKSPEEAGAMLVDATELHKASEKSAAGPATAKQEPQSSCLLLLAPSKPRVPD
eukprot:6166293-Amphidinium_carterae.1